MAPLCAPAPWREMGFLIQDSGSASRKGAKAQRHKGRKGSPLLWRYLIFKDHKWARRRRTRTRNKPAFACHTLPAIVASRPRRPSRIKFINFTNREKQDGG